MPNFLRKFIGLVLLLAAVGIASCQALIASCYYPPTNQHTLR